MRARQDSYAAPVQIASPPPAKRPKASRVRHTGWRYAGWRYILGGLGLALAFGACGEGLRPTLVEVAAQEPEAPLVLNLAPAPDNVTPLPPASQDFPLESSVDDALLAWAVDRNVAYLDSCQRSTPSPGQLCDSPTERDTVRLLGPSSQETWYVVTVLEAFTLDTGRGYRVSSVEIAGR